MSTLRIGTRRSVLALWQAKFVRAALERSHDGLAVELVEITTEGDRTLDVPLSAKGGKGLFLKELEQALLEGRIDIAVHSMKDVTVSLPPGLHIPVVCEREDPSDAFVSNRHASLDELERGARIGTCSLRRQCILRSMFPGLDVVNLRGNVNTRLKRLGDGDFDAIILATAGLKRLDMADRIRARLTTDLFVPAVGQGAVGIECRVDDGNTNRLIAALDHEPSHVRVMAERAANRRLGGGCHVPLGVHARLDGGRLLVDALVGSPDGATVLRAFAEGPVARAEAIGVAVAGKLLDQGAEDILRAVYAHG